LRNKVSVISLHRVTKGEAELLDIRPGASVLRFEGLITGDGQPFEHLLSLNHPDRVSFTIQQSPVKRDADQSNPIHWVLHSEYQGS
jgi:GntR family transcriptional regulator